jgi:peptidoglycan/xylan/chitin deacetylase (PgdA/CDA1 family)
LVKTTVKDQTQTIPARDKILDTLSRVTIERDVARAEVRTLHSSRSWWITAPLRRLGMIARRLSKSFATELSENHRKSQVAVPQVIKRSEKTTVPIILMYHSVPEQVRIHDAFHLQVGVQNFCDHMTIISQERTPIPLGEFVELLDRGTLPADGVAVTCDDGYADNLLVAKPVLDRFAVPATIFLATGLLDTTEFWWDRLERIIFNTTSLPTVVEIEVERSVTVPLGHSKADALAKIYPHLRDLEAKRRDTAIDGLAESLGVADKHNLSRPLTEDEVKALATGTTVIGSHTVSHPCLPRLALDAITRELVKSKQQCDNLVGGTTSLFSYPFGAYDANTREAVIAAGYKLACSTIPLPVSADSDRFALPRIQAKNWNVDEFIQQICFHKTD